MFSMSSDFLHGFAIERWPLLPLRLIVGFGFMEHGFAKLAKGPDAFANILQAMGVPGPHFTAAGPQFGPPGYEVDLLYLACLAALVLGGPGLLTIGGLIRRQSKVKSSSSRPNITAAA